MVQVTPVYSTTHLFSDEQSDLNTEESMHLDSSTDFESDAYLSTDDSSDSCEETSGDSINDVSSIILTERAWKKLVPKKVANIPYDINEIVAYELEHTERSKLTKACCNGRFWRNDSSTKWANYDSVRNENCGGNLQSPNPDLLIVVLGVVLQNIRHFC